MIWDVVVVGGGPAGAAAALGLARQGARVLVVEQRQFPRWKVCGACLSPQALAVLQAMGLDHIAAAGVPLEQLQLGVAGRSLPLPLRQGRALSRHHMDQALLQAAADAGAAVRFGSRAELGPVQPAWRELVLHRRGGKERLRAAVVLLAAGLTHRGPRQEPALHTRIAPGSRVGAGCVLEGDGAGPPEAYPSGVIHMAVGRGGYVGAVRVETGALNLACAFDPAALRRAGGPAPLAVAILAEAGFPPLVEQPAEQSWQLTAPLTRRTRPLAGHRLLLLGDAAGYVEPFTGEGMGWALTAALACLPLVRRGLVEWDPALADDWHQQHRHWVARRQTVCRGLALLLRHPTATAALQRTAALLPSVAGPLLQRVQHTALPPLISTPAAPSPLEAAPWR